MKPQMSTEILRIVDTIHRDKRIEKELVFQGIEQGLMSAARKKVGEEEDVQVTIDRETGEIFIYHGDDRIDPIELGRIAALTAKQIMIQKTREAERDVVFDDFIGRIGELVTGTVRSFDRGTVIVNLGKDSGILPYREQIPGESYHVGERIKVLISEVKKVGQKVKIILSRAHKDLLRHLFQIEVPEIADSIIEIKGLAREAGHRTKIAVHSHDMRVDCVGACVGIRGSRIKNIVDELNGEKIDIVRWSPATDLFIQNSLKPAEINGIEIDDTEKKALVFVQDDQLSLAIGRKGQNVRLASKLTGYELDIVSGTKEQYEDELLGYGKFEVPAAPRGERTSDEITEEDVAAALGIHLEKAATRRRANEARAERLLRKADDLFGSVSTGEKAPWLEEKGEDGSPEDPTDSAPDSAEGVSKESSETEEERKTPGTVEAVDSVPDTEPDEILALPKTPEEVVEEPTKEEPAAEESGESEAPVESKEESKEETKEEDNEA